jgi:hypothetical protein
LFPTDRYRLITTKLLDFVHRPDFYKQKTQRFGNWICFRLQAKVGAPTLQKNQKLAFTQAMPEQKKVKGAYSPLVSSGWSSFVLASPV